jgi:DNA sulfur modification protein DndD
MYIKKIVLRDYRIYYGYNELEFKKVPGKNVFIVSGNNGFGKTTLLTSLVWCLYGKLMGDVDDKFRKEIYESGGYRKFAVGNLNRLSHANGEEAYGVSVVLGDIAIPALPCNEITVTRTFNINDPEDKVQIYIDGQENELTKEVGSEIFINDFILPKEIAKFFFFDAEKIVALAEIKSIEEKRSLSRAYSEVLGIKKYEDLREHLEDLRIRFRRNSASDKDKQKFGELQKELQQHEKLIEEYEQQINILREEKGAKKVASEQYQEKLIREGNSISVNELNDLKRMRNQLTNEADAIKGKIKELLELAPFAIAANKLSEVHHQLTDEIQHTQSSIDPALIRKKARRIEDHIIENASTLNVDKRQARRLAELVGEAIREQFSAKGRNQKEFQVLLNFTDGEKKDFEAMYSNLKNSFSFAFKQLVTSYKNNRITFQTVIRKISNAEAKENDLLIQEIRLQKEQLDLRVEEIEKKLEHLYQEIGGLQREVMIKARLVSELAKRVNLDEADKAKDETAKRLIDELTEFINKLKNEKKKALEQKVKDELNQLMHKSTFVSKVDVTIGEDIIDIDLRNKRGELINKDALSKGEQQLYATALLKALVDESNIRFPVFIDSPLQKFDKNHSRNIIGTFYPNISEQVVLFPLLEKELSETEYRSLLPKVNKAFLIKNIDEDKSTFEAVEPAELFHAYQKQNEHLYAY